MVHVVSIDDVPMMEGSVSFQSNDVSGAQNSLFRGLGFFLGFWGSDLEVRVLSSGCRVKGLGFMV